MRYVRVTGTDEINNLSTCFVKAMSLAHPAILFRIKRAVLGTKGNKLSIDSILSQTIQVHILASWFLKICFHIFV